MWLELQSMLLSLGKHGNIYDSIVIDCKKEYTAEIIKTVEEVFQDLPNIINKLFDINWDLEVRVEIKIGNDLFNLKEIEK